METIRILLYTDYSNISENKHLWGLTNLVQFIKLKINGIANVEFSLMNRHFDYENNQPNINGATRLTFDLLSKYDELWVFAALQMNTTQHPHNELEQDEIDALKNWMKTGGLLLTGDHSDAVENLTCESDHKDFVNLGAALGRGIPRAGELRVWDGPPTGCYSGPLEQRDNHNTQEGDPSLVDDITLQNDALPQTLRLMQDDPPHRLFWWYFDHKSQKIVPITKFPDHIHEGELTVPSNLIGDWPPQSQPPIVVAQGRDKRFPAEQRYYDLVVAYDGDAFNVGRIVADSSFHHYINRNLLRIPDKAPNGEPKPGTSLDQIAQYYCNLALWLAPEKIRAQINWGLFFWVASHPDVLEDKANSPQIVGESALSALEQEIGTSNLYRLLAPSEHEYGLKRLSDLLLPIFLGEKSDSELSVIKPKIAVGYITKEYHHYFNEHQIVDPGWLEQDPTPPEVAVRGLIKAFEHQGLKREEFLSQFRELAEATWRERYAEQE